MIESADPLPFSMELLDQTLALHPSEMDRSDSARSMIHPKWK